MIEREAVEKVLHLARLDLSPEQTERLWHELESILAFVEKLEELDVSNVPPLTHASGDSDVYRDDVPTSPLARDAALANAPDRSNGFFRVPRVIEESS